MAIALEKQLETLISDVHAIQKELILAKTQRLKRSKRRVEAWTALAEKVSLQWDSVSAVDEIGAQREKTW
jgi:hypothetical protein